MSLCITRVTGEAVIITTDDGDIVIQVARITGGSQVRLSIEAPARHRISRRGAHVIERKRAILAELEEIAREDER